MSTGTIWDQVLSRLEAKVGPHSFSTWFKPTALRRDDGQTLEVGVPNPLFVDWLPKPGEVALPCDPQAPFANADGMVAAPNVDLAQELIGQMVAKYTYTANLASLQAEQRMARSLLDAKI